MALFSRPTTRDRKAPQYANGNGPQFVASRPSSTVPSPKSENQDVEMVDVPSTSSPKELSLVAGVTAANVNGQRPIIKQEHRPLLGIKKESNRPSPSRDMNEHGKRSRESSTMEDGGPAKKVCLLHFFLHYSDFMMLVSLINGANFRDGWVIFVHYVRLKSGTISTIPACCCIHLTFQSILSPQYSPANLRTGHSPFERQSDRSCGGSGSTGSSAESNPSTSTRWSCAATQETCR
jgi:hypothetical protein